MVYDVTKTKTFESIEKWFSELKDYASDNIVVMLVGNKTDLNHLRTVEIDDAKQFAEKHSKEQSFYIIRFGIYRDISFRFHERD